MRRQIPIGRVVKRDYNVFYKKSGIKLLFNYGAINFC